MPNDTHDAVPNDAPGGAPRPAPAADPGAAGDLAREVADRVYRLLAAEARLERARGAA